MSISVTVIFYFSKVKLASVFFLRFAYRFQILYPAKKEHGLAIEEIIQIWWANRKQRKACQMQADNYDKSLYCQLHKPATAITQS